MKFIYIIGMSLIIMGIVGIIYAATHCIDYTKKSVDCFDKYGSKINGMSCTQENTLTIEGMIVAGISTIAVGVGIGISLAESYI